MAKKKRKIGVRGKRFAHLATRKRHKARKQGRPRKKRVRKHRLAVSKYYRGRRKKGLGALPALAAIPLAVKLAAAAAAFLWFKKKGGSSSVVQPDALITPGAAAASGGGGAGAAQASAAPDYGAYGDYYGYNPYDSAAYNNPIQDYGSSAAAPPPASVGVPQTSTGAAVTQTSGSSSTAPVITLPKTNVVSTANVKTAAATVSRTATITGPSPSPTSPTLTGKTSLISTQFVKPTFSMSTSKSISTTPTRL